MDSLDFGGVVIGQKLFDCICVCLPVGSTILEIGSGFGTQRLSQFYQMQSIEHEPGWLNRFDSVYIHAPLKNGWYDTEVIAELLSNSYDAILVDGPPWYLGTRQGFFNHLDLFCSDGWLFFDDLHRDDDMGAYRSVYKTLGRPHREVRDSEKIFGVIAAIEVTVQELDAAIGGTG